MNADKAIEILEHMSTAVVICDTELVITYLNDAAQVLFAINPQRAVGHNFGTLIRESVSLVEDIRATLEANRHLTMREIVLNIPASNQSITVDCTVTPLMMNDNDVSAHKGALIELHEVERIMRLVRETAWRERHEANRAVIRGIAHEVRNPLGGLRGAAQLLQRELTQESLKDYTRVIIREADRLNRLVEQMVGPTPQQNTAVVNVHEVLEHIRKLVLSEYNVQVDDSKTGVDYQVDYDPSLPDVTADREQLTQAFLNIVQNAMQAIRHYGILLVRTRVEHQFTIGQDRHRQVLRVDFIDNGPGIPEEMRDMLFYPLVTGRAEGTGLGLSITQEIIRRAGGQIDVQSEPGETVFSVYLPFHRPV